MISEERRICCRLCGHTAETTRLEARADGFDHLLDEHREQLFANRDRVRSLMSVLMPPATRPTGRLIEGWR